MIQESLLDWSPPEPKGATYEPVRDGKRLCAQALRVYAFVKDGCWHTLAEIAAATGDPEPSVSARLRQIRASGFTVERAYVENGLWKYRALRQEQTECCSQESSSGSSSSSSS
jgi:hypothetical protein